MPERIGSGYKEERVNIRSIKEFILKAAAAVTTSSNGGEQVVGDYAEGILDINITAASGTTPTIDFVLQTWFNGRWIAVPGVTFTQITTAAPVSKAVTNFGEKVRLLWTVGGTTPSFTFAASFMAKT